MPKNITTDPNPESVNGWANYATWAVNLWISDGPADDEAAHQLVRDAYDNAAAVLAADPAAIVAPLSHAADALKDMVNEWRDELAEPVHDRAGKAYTNPLTSGLFGDLLTYAIDSVDWRELAEHYHDDNEANDAYEAEKAEQA